MAVSFDAHANGSVGGSALSLTIAHTFTGTNGLLLVAVSTESTNGSSSDSITGVTYNLVAMTQLKKVSVPAIGNTNDTHYLYGIIAPATGTHNIVISSNGGQNGGIFGASASYAGVRQTLPSGTDVISGTASSSTTLTLSTLTPSVANSWVAFCEDNLQAIATLTSIGTLRDTGGVTSIGDTNAIVASNAPAFSVGAATSWGGIAAMVAPFAVSTGSFMPFFNP